MRIEQNWTSEDISKKVIPFPENPEVFDLDGVPVYSYITPKEML